MCYRMPGNSAGAVVYLVPGSTQDNTSPQTNFQDVFSLTRLRLEREKFTTKIDDYGIGHCWLAIMKLLSDLQQMLNTRTGRVQHDPIRTAYCAPTLLWTRRRLKISYFSCFWTLYTGPRWVNRESANAERCDSVE